MGERERSILMEVFGSHCVILPVGYGNSGPGGSLERRAIMGRETEQLTPWRKSRHSNPNGACVEVSAWRKSRHSNPSGACVEAVLTPDDGTVAIRHSRHPEGPVIRYTRAEWEAFLAGVRDGEFSWDALTRPPAVP